MDPIQEKLLIYQALLSATSSLALGNTPDDVLRAACNALASLSSHICLAWMYLGNPEREVIRPSYAAGVAAEYVQSLSIDRSPEAMKGPARRSLAANMPVVVDVESDASFHIWREQAAFFGLKEGLTLPIGDHEMEQRGLIVIFSRTARYFEQVGIEPFFAFTQLASVGLDQARMRMKLEEMSTIDPTTRLLNRAAMQEFFTRMHAQSKRAARHFSLLLLDLDHFKLINDNYGHETGDKMLRGVSDLFGRLLRRSDWVGRWGGEEFLAILPDTGEREAMQIAEQLRSGVEQLRIDFNGREIQTTVSIGVASCPRDGDSPEILLRAADAALYEAKKTGRNRIVVAMEQHEIHSIIRKIDSAIAAGRLVPAYQPIVDLKTGVQVAEEALARLIDEQGNVLPAADFIQAASELQLTHLIDFQIIKRTMGHCVANTHGGITNRLHFVNLSADILLHQEIIQALFDEARQACEQCGIAGGPQKPMVIEITERQFMGDMEAVKSKLAPFLDFGMRLAIDDFGSGYSSFRYLAELPVSYLKIEGTLVQQIHDKRVQKILRRISNIAHDLDLITIAEYVEDEATANRLRDLEIDWAQGYYFGRPELAG